MQSVASRMFFHDGAGGRLGFLLPDRFVEIRIKFFLDRLDVLDPLFFERRPELVEDHVQAIAR